MAQLDKAAVFLKAFMGFRYTLLVTLPFSLLVFFEFG
jgi:hypothetical protein